MNLILTMLWLGFTTSMAYFLGKIAGFGAVGLFWSSVAGFVVGFIIRLIFAKAGGGGRGSSSDDGFFGGMFDSDGGGSSSSCSGGGSCGGGGD